MALLYLNNNGEVLKNEGPTLSSANRGHLYGDGLFESIRVINGRPINTEAHILRMLEGAEKLNLISETLPYAFSPEKFYDSIELLGKENYNNAECFKLKSSKKGMDPVIEYIDVKTYLSHGEVRVIPSPMGKMKATTVYKDYKKHESGFKYPASMTQSMGPVKIEVNMLSIKLDESIDDKIFQTPAQ